MEVRQAWLQLRQHTSGCGLGGHCLALDGPRCSCVHRERGRPSSLGVSGGSTTNPSRFLCIALAARCPPCVQRLLPCWSLAHPPLAGIAEPTSCCLPSWSHLSACLFLALPDKPSQSRLTALASDRPGQGPSLLPLLAWPGSGQGAAPPASRKELGPGLGWARSSQGNHGEGTHSLLGSPSSPCRGG